MNASEPGKLLEGCSWVGVPFAGGMCELPYITARTIVANDLHRHVINLARVVAHPLLGPKLYRRVRRLAFHPEVLHEAQLMSAAWDDLIGDELSLEAAHAYFVCCWMSRSAKAGTVDEFKGGLPIRWNANGGDSCVRYRSAAKSLLDWRRVFARVAFVCEDAFKFLGKFKDSPGHGLYCDPPFPGAGEKYRHSFTESDHRDLARWMNAFKTAKVVMRFYDHPLIRAIYPEKPTLPGQALWTWHRLNGRKQTNKVAPEVLLTNWSSHDHRSD